MDLNGDGKLDVISGSYVPGNVFFFRNRGDGTFVRGKRLRDRYGSIITFGAGTTAFAADWNNDGVLDLVVGTLGGDVFLIPNLGTKEKPQFGDAVRVVADGKAIHIDPMHAAPTVADWDGDGLPDLLVGTGSGSVILYRATGRDEHGNLKLAAGKTLVPPSSTADGVDELSQVRNRPWGGFLRINVVDFNGDGRPDLLLGDLNVELIPLSGMTPEQEKETRRR